MHLLDILEFDNYYTGSLEDNISMFHGSRERMWESEHYCVIEYHYLYGKVLQENIERNFLRDLPWNPIKWILFICFLNTMAMLDVFALKHLAFATRRGEGVMQLGLIRVQKRYCSLVNRYGDIENIYVRKRTSE